MRAMSDVEAVRRDRDQARAELARVRSERDQLRVDLLRASVPDPDSDHHAELASLRAQVVELAARVTDLERELAAHRATISWRITAPLRAVRRRRRP
jgi:cell division protein FtsB